jgi:hypothetical protein
MRYSDRSVSIRFDFAKWTLIPLALSVFLLSQVALAQNGAKSAPVQEGPIKPAAEITEIMLVMGDVNTLRGLNQMKLRPDQIDPLVEVMTTTQAEYNKRVATEATPILRRVAEPIKSAKRNGLAGSDVVDDEAIKQAFTVYQKKMTEINNAVLKNLSDRMVRILTKQQVTFASKFARDEMTKRAGRPMEGTEIQFFNLYIQQYFFVNPRIVPLLREIQAARAAEQGGNK